MITEKIAKAAVQYAYAETEKYGLPTKLHLDLSIQKGIEIAKMLKTDNNIVIVGVALMDIKLGEAFTTKRQPEHVKMSADATQIFLGQFDIDKDSRAKVINCVEAHHGAVPFSCLEAEIVANADCYRFVHPKGVLHFIGTLTKRNLSFKEIIDGAEAKLEEKNKILSLPYCKKELGPYYVAFKKMFAEARIGN
jgi:hypothetical protein